MYTLARASARGTRPAPSSTRRLLPMLALGSVLLAAGGGHARAGGLVPRRAVVHPARHTMAPAPQATSLKPDWRSDAANTGQVTAIGPATLPTESVADAPGPPGVADGIELSADGSALFTLDSGVVYAYRPDGARKWAFPASGTLGSYGHDPAAGASHPTVGADGADYIGNDNGTLYQLDDATGAGAAIFQAPAGAAMQMTPKLGPDGTLYIGDDTGGFYHLAPPALGTGAPATLLYRVTATGAPQPPGAPYTGASRGPFRFDGEAALDGAGDAYAASSDGNPQGTSSQRVGTLYKVGPSGALLWQAGLQGAPAGAVVYAANPLTPTQPLVVVADRFPEVAAFDAATGARVWQYVPADSQAGVAASPALARDGRTLYVADDAGALDALDVATGAPAAGFGVGGRVALPSGTQSSPVVDAAGDLYLGTNAGALEALAPDGRTLWTLPGGPATGASGSGSAKYMSPAIGADGTLYAGGNGGGVRGFRVGGVLPTATAGPAGATPTPAATATAPSTASATPSAAATSTSTDLPTPSGPTPTFPPGPPAGTDLYHLDTANAHYLAGANGTTELRLYNAPVGLPSQAGWQVRDPALRPANPVASLVPVASASASAASPVPLATPLLLAPTVPPTTPGTGVLTATAPLTATGVVTPTGLPFALQLAPTANSPALASLTNEDGVSLTLGLAAINGLTPAPVPGLVGAGGDAITYTAPVAAAPADVALHPTVAGLALRVVLHRASEAGPLALGVAPSAGAYLDVKPGGVIQVTRPFTAYGDDGTAHTILAPEYVIHAPTVLDSAPDSTAAPATAPVSLTLGATLSGAQALLLTVDPAWLRDSRRAYPVSLDLPIETAYSAVHSGLAATVNSCAPDTADTAGRLVVGAAGGCVSHGLLSFDTTPLLADTPIVSATLRLYIPDHIGPTGVQVYPNVPLTSTLPVWEPSPYLRPTWDTAPTVVTGSVGLAQSASEGRWQSWDVTSLVRGWISQPRTNGGLTLESGGMPVRFATPGRVGRDAPSVAPYLDIVYGPRPAVVPSYVSYAPFSTTVRRANTSPNIIPCCGGGASPQIYGVSGTFAAPCGQRQCGNALGIDQAAGLGAQYIRVGVTLQCNRQQPSKSGWWDSHNLYSINKPPSAAPFSPSGIYEILTNAYKDGLTPIINIRLDDGCAPYLSVPRRWSMQVYDFISTLPSPLLSQVRAHTTYFEIANEINNDGPYGNGVRLNNKLFLYTGIFMAAAEGLQMALGNAPWRALTSGMLTPTADGDLPCPDISDRYGPPNLATAAGAIAGAEGGYPYNIQPSHLGVAVHPYSYDTNESNRYWKNYYGSRYGNRHYADICSDLQGLINTWTAAFPPPMQLVFTEDNWDVRPNKQTAGDRPVAGVCNDANGCAATYLADLFTWLHDHNGYDNPSNSPLRVMWLSGVDFADSQGANVPLGLYGKNDTDKSIYIDVCPNNSAVAGGHTMALDYAFSIDDPCY